MSRAELTKYCQDNLDVIFVRTRKDGKWQSLSLRELNDSAVQEHIERWFNEGRVPSRVLESF